MATQIPVVAVCEPKTCDFCALLRATDLAKLSKVDLDKDNVLVMKEPLQKGHFFAFAWYNYNADGTLGHGGTNWKPLGRLAVSRVEPEKSFIAIFDRKAEPNATTSLIAYATVN